MWMAHAVPLLGRVCITVRSSRTRRSVCPTFIVVFMTGFTVFLATPKGEERL
jgi:hypothetical protein